MQKSLVVLGSLLLGFVQLSRAEADENENELHARLEHISRQVEDLTGIAFDSRIGGSYS